MFEHEIFDKYDFDNIPLNTDIYLRDEIFISGYEASLLKVNNAEEWVPVGEVSFVAARRVNKSSIELTWYPNTFDRWHALSIILPRKQIVVCVGCSNYDEKPSIFVKGEWLKNLHLRSNSVFGLIDVDGVKSAILEGALTRHKLRLLKRRMDELAGRYRKISFISFADSVLLKSNWTAGHFKMGVKYTYEPEIFIHLFKEIQTVYRVVLKLD